MTFSRRKTRASCWYVGKLPMVPCFKLVFIALVFVWFVRPSHLRDALVVVLIRPHPGVQLEGAGGAFALLAVILPSIENLASHMLTWCAFLIKILGASVLSPLEQFSRYSTDTFTLANSHLCVIDKRYATCRVLHT